MRVKPFSLCWAQQRLLSRWKVLLKTLDSRGWLARWDAATVRCWGILSRGVPSLERFQMFERNHCRLIRLIQLKTARGLSVRNAALFRVISGFRSSR